MEIYALVALLLLGLSLVLAVLHISSMEDRIKKIEELTVPPCQGSFE